MTTKIIIPMGGDGQRFLDVGYKLPKPLINVKNKTMIEWVIETLRPKKHDYQFIFIVREEHRTKYDIDLLLTKLEPSCEIIIIGKKTEGSGITVLAASHLIYDSEVIVGVCDSIHGLDIDDFIDKAQGKDGLIATFETEQSHFCFVELNKDGFVRCKEKEHISSHASTGLWYFGNGAKMVSALCEGISKNDRVNNEFYSTIAYNYLGSKNIDIYNCKCNIVGTPRELDAYLERKK